MNERLLEWVRRACPVDGLTATRAGDADAAQLQYAPHATVAQRRASLDALQVFDFSADAQAAWAAAGASLAAVSLVAASADPVFTADRISLRYLCTAINEVRAHVGLPRVLEPEIVAGLVAAAMAGAGAPAAIPGGP